MRWLVLALVGCGPSLPECTAPDVVLLEGDASLTCGDVHDVERWISAVAARPADQAIRRTLPGHMVDAYQTDPARAAADLALVREDLTLFQSRDRDKALAVRSSMVKSVLTRDERFGWSAVHADSDRAVAVWESAETEPVALSEADIEAWIFYASLCREVQGGGPLLVSMAARVQIYAVLRDVFRSGSLEDKQAMAAMGPLWRSARDHWQLAEYEKQQAWITGAPLPRPMTGDSGEYISALMTQPPSVHVAALRKYLGPFRFDVPK